MSAAIPPGEAAELARLRAIAQRLGIPEDVRLLSPWAPLAGAELAGASGAGDLLLRFSPVPVLGVTGSAGKTTTSRLAEAMLRTSGIETLTSSDAPADNAWPTAGLLERVLEARPPAWCVVELTSNHLAVCTASPQIACITNVWADHVDQHGSLTAYLAAKRRIVEFQAAEDWAVVNADDPGAVELAAASPARILRCTLRGPASDPGAGIEAEHLVLRIDGAVHDLGPAAALPPAPGPEAGLLAGACALLAGASPDAIAHALSGWQGLALRREHLGFVDGCAVIRDALAATPAKAAAGLELHAPASVVLIAGGDDDLGAGPMHADPEEHALFEQAAHAAARACSHAALFGPAAPRLATALSAAGLTSITLCETLAEACANARAEATPGQTILFAPWFATSPAERASIPALLGL